MGEELVVCGESWWNSPRNLFSSSPCSLPSNDIASFGWPSHDVITETKSSTVRSSHDSDDTTSVVITQDVHNSAVAATPNQSWNPDLLGDSARSEDNYSDFLLDSTMNYQSFDSDEPHHHPINSTTSAAPVTAAASSDSYSYASSLLHTLFDNDPQPQQSQLQQQTTTMSNNYSSSAATYNNQLVHSNGFLPKFEQPNCSRLWNSTAASFSNVRPPFLPSPTSHFLPSSLTNHKQHEQGKDSATGVNKASSEPPFKRARIETPSPLPTFKVRKEKLGDRITALQQLVSPFGKTDTASVLHEAIEYIRFLHDQVNTLSTPYLKYGSPPVQRSQGREKSKDEEGQTKDLKTRGLCLVPISSTFPVAAETTSDFWTPTFGGGSSFR